MKKILVCIIAYNESDNLFNVIKDLNDNNFGYDILLIDNSSYDKTLEIAKENNLDYISHIINCGINGTWKSYFMYAYYNEYDIVCQFDGDGQHLASELPKIIKPILDGDANHVIGSRFLEKNGFQSYAIRRIGISIFSYLLSKIMGFKILDVTSGFLAFDRNVIKFFTEYYRQEISDTNSLHLLSHFSGARIFEVPVEMRVRNSGKSFYNILNSFLYPIYGVVNIAGCLLLKRQIKKDWKLSNER